MPNPDGSLTPDEQALAAGGVPQPAVQPADGTLTNPTAYLAPPPGTPQAAPGAPAPTGDPLLDFVPPGATQAPSATPAPTPSAADAVPLPTSTPFPRGAVKSETLVPSPQARQGAERIQAVAGDERKLVADQQKTAEDEARINQETADRAAEERDRQIAETRANQQAERDRLALVNQERDKAISDAERLSKENGGVNGESAVRGIMALASVVLAGSGRTAASGVFRVGGALLDRKIDGEIRARDAAVKAKYQAIAARDGMNDDVARQYAQAQAENAANNLVMLKNVEAHGAAQLTALGVPKAEQAARLADLGIQQKAAEEEQKLGLAISSKVEAKPVSGQGGAGTKGALSVLQQFARDNPGPENTSKVTALAEKLFPGMKPAQLQSLVGGAIKLDADAVTGGRNTPPKLYHDELTGQDLPVDPSKTDRVAHDHAKATLAPINTFLKTAQDLLDRSKKPNAPEWVAKVGSNAGGENAEARTDVKRLRSAYAKAKGESIGEANAKELADAIPDVPTWPATDASMNNWRRVTQRYIDEMKDLRAENLANAGVNPSDARPSGKGESPKTEGFVPGTPKMVGSVRYVEVSPNNWQPQ